MGEVYALWMQSLKLQVAPFLQVQTAQGFAHSVAIFVCAALSKGLSDAGIMMINRVTRAQFVRGLAGGTLTLAVAALCWSGCIWLACLWPIGKYLPYREVLGLVLLSYAPLVFALLAIVPHLGLLWDGILKVWMLLITIAGLTSHHGVALGHAIAASGLGWLLFHLLGELFGTRVEKLRLRLLGRDHWIRPKDAVARLLEKEMARG
jgi:hypothetical protein